MRKSSYKSLVNASLISCLLTVVLCEQNITLSCKIDFRSNIIFQIVIPGMYKHDTKLNKPSLYYARNENGGWMPEDNCWTNKQNELFECRMSKLTRHRVTYYYFKFSIRSHTTTHNISKFYFQGDSMYPVSPWITKDSYVHCKQGVGTKYVALNASYNNITVEWIKYPLSVDYKLNNSDVQLRIKSAVLKQERSIDMESNCLYDMCSYVYTGLTSCSKYNICVVTYSEGRKKSRKEDVKCKVIRTYCNFNSAGMEWQEILLIVIICIVCCIVLCGLVHKCRSVNRTSEEDDDDDQLMPRVDENSQDTDSNQWIDATHNYEYPEVMQTSDVYHDLEIDVRVHDSYLGSE